MTDTPREEPVLDPEATWLDREATKNVNGIYANRLFVQPLGDGMIRLNFGEILDELDPRYHTAIVVSVENAKAFSELIYGFALALSPPPEPVVPPLSPAGGEHGEN